MTVGPGLRGPVGLRGALPLLDGRRRQGTSCRIDQGADCNLGRREAVQPSFHLPAAPSTDPCRLSPRAQFQGPVAVYSAAAIGPQVGGLQVSCRIAKLHPNFAHFLPLRTPACGMEKTWSLRQLTEASINRVRRQRRIMPSQYMYRSDGTLVFCTNSAKVPCHEHDGTIPD